jgi:succinyl-diaminopimelate desuccinylase
MDAITLLKELVSINSIFPNEGQIAEFIEMILIENGFNVARQEVEPGRFNVVAERGTRGKPILFYAHMDTVPAYGQWESDPFKLTERDGRLYGLGVFDTKGGLAAILKASEIEADRRLKLAFTVDEENISAGAHALVRTNFLNDVEGAIVAEVADNSDESLGPRKIILGRRGRVVYEFSVPGKSAHGAHINDGINAITEASKLALALERMNNTLATHELLPRASQFVRRLTGESSSLSFPEKATLELDRHLVIPETQESVLAELKKFIDSLYASGEFKEIDGRRISVKIKERKTPYLMPYVIDKEDQFVQQFVRVIKEKIGEPIYSYGYSVADENIIATKGIPIVSVGPVGGNEHAANEWISKASYLALIDVLKTFIKSS